MSKQYIAVHSLRMRRSLYRLLGLRDVSRGAFFIDYMLPQVIHFLIFYLLHSSRLLSLDGGRWAWFEGSRR